MWCLGARFLGVKFFLGFEIYFWVGLWKSKGNDESKGNNFVASPFGLRSGLRQSGSAFRRELFVGLKPHANPKSNNPTLIRKATTKRKADPPPSAKDDNKKGGRMTTKKAKEG